MSVILLLIDPQIDFHEGGSLAVPGSTADSLRIAKMIEMHGDDIDEIYVTLDSHHRTHIAHGIFWTNQNGDHPAPFTQISKEDIAEDKWMPRDPTLKEHCKYYANQLETQGNRFKLMIWPEHCLIGSVGHAVIPSIHSVITAWSGKKNKVIHYVMKGMNCLTEMYSAVTAEVPIVSDPSTQVDPRFIDAIKKAEKLIIGGQALSHCVRYTLTDIVKYWHEGAEEKKKIILLRDGCSPVAGFEDAANQFVDLMRNEGVTVTTCSAVFGDEIREVDKAKSIKKDLGALALA